MGQSHSQPSSVRQRDLSNVVNQPQAEPTATDAPASPHRDTAPIPRRRAPTSGASRNRLSTLFRGKRPESTAEPTLGERGEPLNAAGADHGISVPPLSVKSRSLRRLFNRRSWAPSGLHNPPDAATALPRSEAGRQPESSHSSTTASGSHNASATGIPREPMDSSNAAERVSPPLSPLDTPPSVSEGNDHTPRRAPTKREIAMLSGTPSPTASSSHGTPTRGLSASSETPSTPSATMASTDTSSDPASDAPVSVVLEEDPAALGLSRPASWHSFTHEDSHEADLATVDAISVAEVGEDNKHAALPEEPIATTDEPLLDMDLGSDVAETSHPRSSAAEPSSSIAPALSELASSINSLPPNPNIPVLDETANTTTALQNLPPTQPAIVPPLPVIPAGTTMIIQGVVQAAEDPARPPRRRPDLPPATPSPDAPASLEGTSDPTSESSTTTPASNSHARLTGTFGDDAQNARRSSQESENPSGAAELLGALLIAAASATANMLMSDPPGSSNSAASNTNTEQASAGASTPVETPSTNEPSGSRLRSSVGVGPRPRPRTMHVGDGDGSADYLGRSRDRPRSLMSSLRDRMFGGPSPDEEALSRLLRSLPGSSSSERGHRRTRSERLSQYPVDEETPTPPLEDPARDPIESLRERIASELMRALANREGQAEDPSSAVTAPPRTPPTEQAPSTTSPAGGLTSLPLSLPSPSTAMLGPGDQHPEGSFERFLQDTNAELRRTLQERMSYREAATAVPIAVPIGPSEGTPAETIAEPVPEAEAPSQPQEPEPEPVLAPADEESQATPAGTRLVHRAPEGVIEPRLNWWRMHRFPARTVAATSSPDSQAPAPSPAPESTAAPEVNVGSSPEPSTTPTSQASTILIPVIVVGIRTAPTTLVQEIGALAAPPPPPTLPEIDSGRPSPLLQRNGSSSSITIRAPQDRTPRPSWARALENVTRALAARRRYERERSQRARDSIFGGPSPGPIPLPSGPMVDPPAGAAADGDAAARDRTRNYLIWVIGGYYPESHPILTSPNLLLNQFDQDDFWGLAELLGQVKPPVASKNDIEQSGLEIIKASQVAEYEKEGKITSNTSERCLICLSDYEEDEEIRVMSCKHAFHQPCVDKWLEVGRNNCPACRSKGVEVQETPAPAETSTQSAGPSTSAA